MIDEDELLALVDGLGKNKDRRTEAAKAREAETEGGFQGRYEIGPDCISCLKSLVRHVKNEMKLVEGWEGSEPVPREVYLLLAQWKIVQNDLIPLFSEYRTDFNVTLPTLTLLLSLTQPPDEKSFDKASQYQALHSYREACLAPDVLSVFVGTLEPLMRKRLEPESRMEPKECKYFETMLVFLTNILKAPNDNFSSTRDSNRGVWNSLIHQLEAASVFDLIVVTIHTNSLKLQHLKENGDRLIDEVSDGETQEKVERYNLIILELLYLLYRTEDIEELGRFSPSAEKEHNKENRSDPKAHALLADLLSADHKQKALDVTDLRHTNFGGTLVTPSRHRVCSAETFFGKQGVPDAGKARRFHKKNCRVEDPTAQSSGKTKRVLSSFLDRYMKECHEEFQPILWEHIQFKEGLPERDQDGPSGDTVLYILWWRIILQWTRSSQQGKKEMIIEDIASLLTEEKFEFAFRKLEFYRLHKYFGPLHAATTLTKELFMIVAIVNDNSKIPQIRAASMKLSSQIVYKKENIDLVFDLVKSFQPHINTRGYLTDLVQLVHLIIKVLEFVSKEGHIFVKRLRKANPKERAALLAQRKENLQQEIQKDRDFFVADGEEEEGEDDAPNEAEGDALETNLLSPSAPTDGDTEETQETNTGAEVQPDADTQPTADPSATTQEETEEVERPAKKRRIVVDDDEVVVDDDEEPQTETTKENPGLLMDEEDEAQPNSTEDTEEWMGVDHAMPRSDYLIDTGMGPNEEGEEDDGLGDVMVEDLVEEETALSLDSYLFGFAHPSIMQAYLELLQNYATNTPTTNRCLAKMLQRISTTLELPTILFNIGYLTAFQSIYEDKHNKTQQPELYRVASSMIRQFVTAAQKKPETLLYSLFFLNRWDATALSREDEAKNKEQDPIAGTPSEAGEDNYQFLHPATAPNAPASKAMAKKQAQVQKDNAALLTMEDSGGDIDYEEVDGLARILARHKRLMAGC